jgi:hypothetical protein
MSKFFLVHDTARRMAVKAVQEAPEGFTVEISAPRRSPDQNARMWAMLTDISQQVKWYGTKLTPDDWKDVFSASLRKARVVPTIDGDGFVPLGMRTSQMTKTEFGALMDLIEAFGAERGVVFHEREAA